MSTTIDQRVVEMRFDNKQFETNVAQTMSTLDKLKQKLNLSKTAKGLDNLNTAAKNVNMTGLGTAVDTVSAKFSALQVMGVTALANITNSAVNAGKNIVKALTIDPVRTGFSEYETKMGSIQTILANTEHQGTKLDDVTAALEELNVYADKTIYNFQEMTRNIGTFTAAGVDLDTSVKSIKGIANLAAVSGSTSQQASTAMYQLSQALATGTVRLQDWNSVVNAGMGGKVFQNALIQTAAMLDGAAEDVEAWQAENIDAFGSFRDSLTQGEWLTTEVLTRTLNQFTMTAKEGSDEWEAFKQELMDTGYTEAQAEGILKMANTASDAATKVKTFTQLIDTLKESAQSGWAQTWEMFVGDFEEAKKFFTELSDLFGGIINDSADRRNNFFTDALSSNWDKLIAKINEAGLETEKFEEQIREVVGNDKLDGLISEYGSLEEAIRKGAISSDVLKKALDGILTTDAGSGLKDFVQGLKEIDRTLQRGHIGEDVKKLQTALKDLGYDLGNPGIDGIIGPITEKAIKSFQEANGIIVDGIAGPETIAALEKAGSKVGEITNEADDLTLSCSELIDEITKKSGRELLLESLMNVIKAIHRPLAAIGEALRNVFSISPTQLYGALEGLNKFTRIFVMDGVLDSANWDELTSKINDLGITTHGFRKILSETLSANGVDVDGLIKKYGSLGEAFDQGAISIEMVKEALLSVEGITETLLLGGESADKLRRSFEGLFSILSIFTTFAGGAFKVVFKIFTALLGKFDLGILDFTAMVGDALKSISDYINGIIDSGIDALLEWLIPKIDVATKAIGKWVDAFKESELGKNIVNAIENWPETFDKIGSAVTRCVSAVSGWVQEFMALPIVQDAITRLGNVFRNVYTRVTNFFSGGLDRIKAFIDYVKSFDNITLDDLGLIFQNFKDNVLDYFANGAVNAFNRIRDALKNFKEFISVHLEKAGESFDTLWGKISALAQFVKEKFNEHVGIGGLIAAVLGIGLVFAVKKLGDVLELVAKPFELLDTINDGIGKVLNSVSLAIKAFALNIAAGALIKIAIAIAILAASLTVLGMVDWKSLLVAGGILLVLTAGLLGIAFIMSKLEKISINVGGKMNNTVIAIVAIAAAIFILAQAMKTLDGLDQNQIGTNLLYIATLAIMLATVSGVMGKYVPKMSEGSMFLLAFAGAIWIMANAMLQLNDLSLEGIEDKIGLILGLMGGLALVAAACKGVSGWSALSVLGAVLALKILVGMVDDIAGVDTKVIEDNIWSFVAIFGAFAVLMATSHLAGKHAGKAGAGILAMSVALLLVIQAIKILGDIPTDTLVKGGIAVGLLMVVFAALVAVSYFAGANAAKAGVMLLAMSGAMLILTVVIFALSKLDPAGLDNAMRVITRLGLVFMGLIAVTHFAKEANKTIIAISIAVAVLAAAIAVLSLVNPDGLWNATGAIAALMVVFGGLVFVTKYAQKVGGTMLVLMGVVIALAGILYLLQGLPVNSTLANTAALVILVATMAIVLKGLSTIKHIAGGALVSMGVMLLIVAGIAAIFWAMDALDIEASIETAVALSTLLLSMSAACLILAGVGAFSAAAVTGAVTMAAIVAGVAIFLGALGALVTYFPDLELWVNKGIGLLDTLCTGIGKALGSLVGGFLDGATDDLGSVADNLSSFMEKLQPFFDGVNSLDDSFGTKVESVVNAIATLVAAEMWGTITSWLPGSEDTLTNFGTQLGSLGTALSDFMTNAAGVTPEAVTPIVDAAAQLASIQPPKDGLFDNDGIDNFGTDLVTFGTSLASFFAAFSEVTIDAEKVRAIVDVANQLGSIVVPDDGWFGGDGIDNFGKDLSKFAMGLAGFFSVFSEVTIDSAKVTAVVDVANKLATINIPDDGMFGGDGIDNFGRDIYNFGVKLRDYSIVASEINTTGVSNATTAMTDITTTINKMAGLDTSGIGTFKDAIKELGSISLGNVSKMFSGAADAFKSAGSRLVDSITKGIKSEQSSLRSTAEIMVKTVSDAIKNKTSEFNTAGKEIATKFAKGILDKKSAAKTAGTTNAAQAVSGAKSKYDSMVSAGGYLGDGLVEGIEAKVDDAYNAGYALGAAAVQGEKDGQQSNSPSKATMQAGEWLGEGLIIGIHNMSKAVNKAGFGMGKGAISSLSNSISKISDVVSTDIDAQPTIRPVLDLDDVKTGAAAISSILGGESAFGLTANANVVGAMMNRRGQNGANDDVVGAIDRLQKSISGMGSTTNIINGVTYDDGSNLNAAVQAIVRAVLIEGRV